MLGIFLEYLLGIFTFSNVLKILIVVWLLTRYWNRPGLNLPPGPTEIPILGNIFSLRKLVNITDNIRNLKYRCYSDIVHYRIFNQHTIIFYRFTPLKRALLSGAFDVRPPNITNDLFNNKGIVAASGDLWKVHRRFALSVLHDFGMGKVAIEDRINEEIYHLEKELMKYEGTSVDIGAVIDTSVSNVICSICFGKRFEYNDEKFHYLTSRFRENITLLPQAQALNFFSWLKYLPGDFFKYHRMKNNIELIRSFVRQRVDEHRFDFNKNDISDFIDAYMAAQKDDMEKNGEDSLFTDQQLVDVVVELFMAGTETNTTTLLWTFLTMVLKPSVQQKVQDEIDQNVPRSRRPTMADRLKLPYTAAVLNEVQRCFYILPVGMPRTNTKQTKLLGYDIPPNSVITFSTADIFKDANFWPNPDEFDPEGNFLDDKGHLLHRENFIPFSLGKRSCLGESLARMELFIYFTSLLQKFSFEVDQSRQRPSFEPEKGFIFKPKPFNVIVKSRE